MPDTPSQKLRRHTDMRKSGCGNNTATIHKGGCVVACTVQYVDASSVSSFVADPVKLCLPTLKKFKKCRNFLICVAADATDIT